MPHLGLDVSIKGFSCEHGDPIRCLEAMQEFEVWWCLFVCNPSAQQEAARSLGLPTIQPSLL